MTTFSPALLLFTAPDYLFMQFEVETSISPHLELFSIFFVSSHSIDLSFLLDDIMTMPKVERMKN